MHICIICMYYNYAYTYAIHKIKDESKKKKTITE